jgi:diguanylate cyclase (GGDEF)-like protein
VALDISEGQRRLEELQQLQQSLELQHQQAYQQASSLAEAHAALARLSTVDAPTGLPNRLHFEHGLMRAVAQAQRHGLPLTLVWLKLQGLRQCNARDGLLAGDRAFQAFANLVGLSLGQGETAGRLGSADFALLLPERDRNGAQRWLADLQARVDASETLRAAGLSVSHGLAECLADDTADQLLLRADDALRRPD